MEDSNRSIIHLALWGVVICNHGDAAPWPLSLGFPTTRMRIMSMMKMTTLTMVVLLKISFTLLKDRHHQYLRLWLAIGIIRKRNGSRMQ